MNSEHSHERARAKPPNPPDKSTEEVSKPVVKPSFRSVLTAPYPIQGDRRENKESMTIDMVMDSSDTEHKGPEINPSQINNVNLDEHHLGIVTLSEEDKERIYRPWMYSIILKVIGKRINHLYLKTRLKALWKTSEEIILIDLGYDY